MAIVRVQSIRVSSLRSALKHRFDPGPHEKLVRFFYPPEDMFSFSDSELSGTLEYFRWYESCGGRRKIRKNSVVQELVISFPPGQVDEDSVKDSIQDFFRAYKKIFGFYPPTVAFLHVTREKMFHVHIIFSLMDPERKRKVRWNKRTYFDLKREMGFSVHSTKGLGAYPLWLIRKIEAHTDREAAKKIVQLARKLRLTADELYQQYLTLYTSIVFENEQIYQRKDGLTPGPDL